MNLSSRLFLSFLLVFASACASPSRNNVPTNPDSSPDATLAALKSGNKRFVSGKVRTDGQSSADILKLSTGQAPSAVVLSCSDSRVPPEAVFDKKLGEIFTVRTAGEALSPPTIGSIEYAIANLGSKLIVVLGHTGCGAVKATLDTPKGKSAGSQNLDALLADIRPRLKSGTSGQPRSADLKDESLENASGVAKDLMERSEIISTAVKSGKVKIISALYHLSDGTVTFE